MSPCALCLPSSLFYFGLLLSLTLSVVQLDSFDDKLQESQQAVEELSHTSMPACMQTLPAEIEQIEVQHTHTIQCSSLSLGSNQSSG